MTEIEEISSSKIRTLSHVGPDPPDPSTLLPGDSSESQQVPDLSQQVPDLFFNYTPKLRVLRLYDAPIKALPSSLSGLSFLEVLDVSVAGIEVFPADIIIKLTNLKRLNWNQCGFTEGVFDNMMGATIYARKASFFQPLRIDSHPDLFKRFRFFAFPPGLDDDLFFRSKQFVYHRIYLRDKHFAKSTEDGNCLEIKGEVQSWDLVSGILDHVDFLALRDTPLSKLSELGVGNLKGLKKFCIEGCQEIVTVANGEEIHHEKILESLENLWMSGVPKLRSLCEGNVQSGSFACLKHLYLEACPILKNVFTSDLNVEKLESLEIRYCDKLERILGEEVEDAFPNLKSLILWELPEFGSICRGGLPALKKLRVRECPKLEKLPLDGRNEKSSLEIRGETKWWNKLVWINEEIKNRLQFKEWSRF